MFFHQIVSFRFYRKNMVVEKVNYILRPWSESDRDSLAYYADDIYVWNNVRDSFPHPYTLEDADAYIKMASIEPYSQFAIEVSGNAVGGIGFIRQSDIERFNAEVGYWIGKPFQGLGIVSDALSELVNYAFTETDLIRLYALTFDYNKKSMRVLERNGFKHLTVMNRMGVKNGKIIDMHYYELLKPF